MVALATVALCAAERTVEPEWLYRNAAAVTAQPSDVTTPACRYKPLFGAGDAEARVARGVARYGEMLVAPGGECATVNYPAEEQIYVVLEGEGALTYGVEKYPIRKDDFLYVPPGVQHSVTGNSEQECRIVVMGFKVPADKAGPPPEKLLIANLAGVQKQMVAGHPPTVLYQLMIGDARSKRDRIAAGRVVTSLYVMEFEPGGTNFPHHHDDEEEIYYLLDGSGEMVAGGGMNGLEGRHPAKAGDAYFFRMNCTVGFYNSAQPGAKARILAVRSLYPRRRIQ